MHFSTSHSTLIHHAKILKDHISPIEKCGQLSWKSLLKFPSSILRDPKQRGHTSHCLWISRLIIAGYFMTLFLEEATRTSPTKWAYFKSLLTSCLLTSHWPKQVTRRSSELCVGEEGGAVLIWAPEVLDKHIHCNKRHFSFCVLKKSTKKYHDSFQGRSASSLSDLDSMKTMQCHLVSCSVRKGITLWRHHAPKQHGTWM